MDNSRYWIRYRGVVDGAFTRDEMLAKKRLGQIPVVASISTDKIEWTLARNVEWLFPPATPPKPPQPPIETLSPTGANQHSAGLEAGDSGIATGSEASTERQGRPVLAFAGAFLVTLLIAGGIVAYLAKRPAQSGAGPFDGGGTGSGNLNTDIARTGYNEKRIDANVGMIAMILELNVEFVDGHSMKTWAVYASGTAFAVSKDGYLLSCRHVVTATEADEATPITMFEPKKKGESLLWSLIDEKQVPPIEQLTFLGASYQVRFGDNVWLPADLVYASADRDVAVLHVNNRTFAAPFEVANSYQRGTKVAVLGFPGVSALFAQRQDLEHAVDRDKKRMYDTMHGIKPSLADAYPSQYWVLNQTSGIVTALPSREGPHGELMQTNALIREGNSGGPLLDDQERVVGIATLRGVTQNVPVQVTDAQGRTNTAVITDEGTSALQYAFALDEMVPQLRRRVPQLTKQLIVEGESSAAK